MNAFFFGREQEQKVIEERVLREQYGNLSLTGLPGVGKSALIEATLLRPEAELLSGMVHPTLCISLSMSSMWKSRNFYFSLASAILQKLETPGLPLMKGKEKIRELLSFSESDETTEITSDIRRAVKLLKAEGVKLIFIFDCFDEVVDIWRARDYQFMRELSSNPETHVCLVTLSRIPLSVLAQTGGDTANFSATFNALPLSLFREAELETLKETLRKRYRCDEATWEGCLYYAGGFPGILSDLLQGLYAEGKSTGADYQTLGMEAADRRIADILAEMEIQDLKNRLLQLVAGPYYEVSISEIEALERYGLVHKVPLMRKYKSFGKTEGYVKDGMAMEAFSPYFTGKLLQERDNEQDFWQNWCSMERLLRRFIDKTFPGIAGERDVECAFYKLRQKDSKIKFIYDNAHRFMRGQLESDLYADPSRNILDYMSFSELFSAVILSHWSRYGAYFPGNIRHWKDISHKMRVARNGYAHNNGDRLLPAVIKELNDACFQIKAKIEDFLRNVK
jgi:hypothetical protein